MRRAISSASRSSVRALDQGGPRFARIALAGADLPRPVAGRICGFRRWPGVCDRERKIADFGEIPQKVELYRAEVEEAVEPDTGLCIG